MFRTWQLPALAPDHTQVSFLEKIFDWEYYDPFGRNFDGEARNVRDYLMIASEDHAAGYPINSMRLPPSRSGMAE
jgi:hypothetical protein